MHQETATLNHLYEPVDNWLDNAGEPSLRDIADVAVDADGLVYVLVRGPGRILVLTSAGEKIQTLGERELSIRPHGIEVAADGTIYCVDERRHAIAVFTRADGFRGWIGAPDSPSDTGVDPARPSLEARLRSIRRTGPPFNLPTHLTDTGTGEVYVTDGYGNAAVHRMSDAGALLATWGGPGEGKAEFRVPHYACLIGPDKLAVCDRENGRIQLFDRAGNFIEIWPAQRPSGIAFDSGNELVYVAEMGVDCDTFLFARGQVTAIESPKISVLSVTGDRVGEIISYTSDPTDSGSLILPHGIAVDSSGDIYVAETTTTYRQARESYSEGGRVSSFGARIDFGSTPGTFHSLQKFRRRGQPD
jgi:DNA-binding beta-propeller fold protein YncE